MNSRKKDILKSHSRLSTSSNEVASVHNYKPISLIHVLRKLLSKVLSKSLSLRINELVHPTHDFIKRRFIQDNFKLVQV
jgi:hypothetical protein